MRPRERRETGEQDLVRSRLAQFGIPFVVNMIEEAIVAEEGGVEYSPLAFLFGFENLRFVRCPHCGRPFRAATFLEDTQQRVIVGPCPHCGYP